MFRGYSLNTLSYLSQSFPLGFRPRGGTFHAAKMPEKAVFGAVFALYLLCDRLLCMFFVFFACFCRRRG